MSDVLVRPARREEATAVGALIVAAYDHEGYLVLPDGRRDEGYASWLADAGNRQGDAVIVVAVDERDELLGAVTWCPPGSPHREISTSDQQAEFRTLAVSPAARGRGVGGALVDWCLAEARRTGMREVLLCSLPEMTAAHRLYTGRGFVRRSDLDWSPFPDVGLLAFSIDLTTNS